MDPKSYEQFGLGEEQVGEAAAYLKEGITVRISFYQGEPLSLELPMKMEFTIEETGPDIRGDSATNIWKTAALDNGLVIKVPLFIKTGEKILVDTRTGEYLQKIAQ
jgi:elongation factor P